MSNVINCFQDADGKHLVPSNFYHAPMMIGNEWWGTVEHFYQAMKTTDSGLRDEIRLLPSPGAAKRAGRSLLIRDDWEQIKLTVMRLALSRKFALGNECGLWLLASAPAMLVEGNTWGDRFWGVDGTGENWLGHLLMAKRAELQSELADIEEARE